MQHRVLVSEAGLSSGAEAPVSAGWGPRSRPGLRVLVVIIALVWTQFPFSGGGASAEGDRELALCCAWGKSLEDDSLTYSVSSPDAPSAEVIRTEPPVPLTMTSRAGADWEERADSIVVERLTRCNVLGAVASHAVSSSAAGASNRIDRVEGMAPPELR